MANETEHGPFPAEPVAASKLCADPELLSPPTEIQNVLRQSRTSSLPRARRAEEPVSPVDLNIRDYEHLKRRTAELGSGDYLVAEMLPKRSIGLLVGDSGLGKSPLLYQLAICVAAGIPFLGLRVQTGRVLYCDFENGLADVCQIVEHQAAYLSLTAVPPTLSFWNYNDCAERYGKAGHTILDMVVQCKPVLTILDSLSAFCPDIEEKNVYAIEAFKELRLAIRDSGTTFMCVHHRKKPSTRAEEAPTPLEHSNVREWLQHARGAGALINGSDIRLGVDFPRRVMPPGRVPDDRAEQVALIMRGFGRVHGEIGPIYIARSIDDDGEPAGYRRIVGAELLFNAEQEAALAALGQTFSTGEAMRAYGRRDQATADFLKRALQIGLIRKVGRGRFEKPPTSPERAEQTSNILNSQRLVEGRSAGVERSAAE